MLDKTSVYSYRRDTDSRLRLRIYALMLCAAICLAALSGCSVSSCSGSTDSLNSVINSGQLVFGIAPDMEPFSFVLSEGTKEEYADIINAQNAVKENGGAEPAPVSSVSDLPAVSAADASESDVASKSDTASGSDKAGASSTDAAPSPVSRTDTAIIEKTDDTVAEYTGLSVDLAEEITALLNVRAVFVPVEPERAFEALENNEIDCYLYLAAVDIKTAATMNTIDTGLDYRQIFVVPRSGEITKLSELAGRKLGCVSNSDTADALSQATLIRSEVSQTIYYSDADAMLGAVSSGDLDCAAINEPLFIRRSGDYAKLRAIDDLLEESDLVIAMNLRDDTLGERVTILYDMLKNEGTIERLEKKWLSPGSGQNSGQAPEQ